MSRFRKVQMTQTQDDDKNRIDCETRLGLVLKNAKLGFWDFGRESTVLNWSGRAKEFFGLTPETVITYDLFMRGVHPDDRERTHRAIQRTFETDQRTYDIEFRTIGINDGVERIVCASGTVVTDEADRPLRLIGVSTDVTEERRHQHELRLAKNNAELASVAKSQFLANMSHEIRTPLGAILGYAELAINNHTTEEERYRFLTSIQRNGELLHKLIDQILDLSKVEANKVDLENVKFSLPRALDEVVSALRIKAAEKSLQLLLRSEGKVPELVETDPLRFKQILMNIIGNAVKFTSKGSVTVTVRLAEAPVPGERLTIVISVCDTGIEISQEKRRHIFERFSQADNSITRKYGGTGLGLALSKELALALGGDLILKETSPRAGSTFEFFFPDSVYDESLRLIHLGENAGADADRRTQVATARLDGLRVLAVDDSEDNQFILLSKLQSAGAQVETAQDGQEAVQKALKDEFDLVLMDIQMPVLDGVSAMRKLREAGFRKPIIALSAHAMKKDKKKSLEQGFDDHLSKPIQLRDLVREVAHHSGLESRTQH